VGGGAEDVFELVLLEDAGRAAVEQNEKPLELFGRGRDREAVAGADIAQHRVDMIAFERVAHLLDLLGGAARLVDQLQLDLQAAEPDLVVGLGQAPGIERIDDGLDGLHGRLAERFRRRPGKEGDDAELEHLLVLSGRAGRQRTERGGRDQTASGDSTIFHGWTSLGELLEHALHGLISLAGNVPKSHKCHGRARSNA